MSEYGPAADRLAEYVGLPAATPFVGQCAADAMQLVSAWLIGCDYSYDPGILAAGISIARAELEVGAELFHRKNTKNAVAQFASPDGTPVRIARDPMVAAYPILRQLVGGGFA